MTRPGIEPRSPGPLANTLTPRLFFRKNKYQIRSYMTFNMVTSKRSIYIWKFTCCLFLNKREVLSRFFGKANIFKYVSTCQTRSNAFWIMNAICRFVYLFLVYLSFAPVTSASILHNVNYSDIQVLMMVTKPEMLTSTLHHNQFTYLGHFFSAAFIYILGIKNVYFF